VISFELVFPCVEYPRVNVFCDLHSIDHHPPLQHVFVVTAYTGGVSVDAIRPDGSVLMHFDRAT
jgi:hypothetical protein